MSDRCNKTRKLSAKKAKHRRCYFRMNKTSGAGTGTGTGGGGDGSSGNSDSIIAKNQMASSMQQFCIDSNAARKCSLSGKTIKLGWENLLLHVYLSLFLYTIQFIAMLYNT